MKTWMSCLLLALLMIVSNVNAEYADFEEDLDPGVWTLLGTATVENGQCRLTEDMASQGGAIFLNQPVTELETILVSFDLIIESPSVTADGCVFTISSAIELGETGGQMGFTGPGIYGVEFDTYNNGFDPTFSDHVAWIDSSAENHGAYGDFFFPANQAMEVQIALTGTDLEVKIDETLVLVHTLTDFDPAQEAFLGISASTGALSDAYVIDNLLIRGTSSPVTLDLVGTTTVIPPNGGTVVFDAFISSDLPGPVFGQAWTMVTTPAGTEVGPLVQVTVPIIPGTDSYIGLTQPVPAIAPAGIYTFTANLGTYPQPVVASDSFEFEKIGTTVAEDGPRVDFPRPDWSGTVSRRHD